MANLLQQSDVETLLGLPTGTGPTSGLITAAQAACFSYLKREIIQAERIEYYDGRQHPQIVLRAWPVAGVANVWLDPNGHYGQGDNAFEDPTTLLVQGEDYSVSSTGTTSGSSRFGTLNYIRGGGSYGWPNGWPLTGFAVQSLSPLGRAAEFGWPAGAGNIKVQYTAGYETIPEAILTAIALQSTYYQRTAKYGGSVGPTSESLGAYSYSLGSNSSNSSKSLLPADALLGSVQALLSPFKEVALGAL